MSQIKLLEIPLSIATGKSEKGNLFKTQFRNLIDVNKSLTENQTLNCLYATLKEKEI